MKNYLLTFSDTHGGAITCLLNPETTLSSEPVNGQRKTWKVEPNPYQDNMWHNHWLPDLAKCAEIIGPTAPVTVIHGGDPIHGNMLIDQLMGGCTSPSNQQIIATQAFDPISKLGLNIQRVYILHGTEVHGGLWGSASEVIADKLRTLHNWDVIATPHGKLYLGDFCVDAAHHGPPVGEAWLRGNSALLYLKRRIEEERANSTNEPPNLFLRYHFHDWVNVAHNDKHSGVEVERRLLVIPSMCGPNGWARKATREKPYSTVGFCLIELDGIQITRIFPMLRILDNREVFRQPLSDIGVQAQVQKGTPRPGVRAMLLRRWAKKQ